MVKEGYEVCYEKIWFLFKFCLNFFRIGRDINKIKRSTRKKWRFSTTGSRILWRNNGTKLGSVIWLKFLKMSSLHAICSSWNVLRKTESALWTLWIWMERYCWVFFFSFFVCALRSFIDNFFLRATLTNKILPFYLFFRPIWRKNLFWKKLRIWKITSFTH